MTISKPVRLLGIEKMQDVPHLAEEVYDERVLRLNRDHDVFDTPGVFAQTGLGGLEAFLSMRNLESIELVAICVQHTEGMESVGPINTYENHLTPL